MKKPLLLFLLICGALIQLRAQLPEGFRKGNSLSYSELISAYRSLDERFLNARLLEVGQTDSGRPLHLFLMQSAPFAPDESLEQMAQNRLVILINNGIHPGESCGIDASLWFSDSLLNAGFSDPDLLIAIIPVYNVSGLLQRRPHTRANQIGPHLQGFRANAQNLDLNRDFIKADALNTQSFFALFQALKPQLFLDTHTSNGADYQYTMSLISTQKDKLAPPMRSLLVNKIEPDLYRGMKARQWPMTPYVNVFGTTPDKGFSAFLETPRYASGYTSLFNCLGFISEAHMLKPYPQRVWATISFIEVLIETAQAHRSSLWKAQAEAARWQSQSSYFPLNWSVDSSSYRKLEFDGYDYRYEPSTLGNYERLRYLRDKPVQWKLPYYSNFQATDSARMPRFYVIPQAWREVILRLQYQQVKIEPLKKDTLMEVESAYIRQARFSDRPYEGHFYLQDFELEKRAQKRLFLAGDYLVSAAGNPAYFLSAVLEPQAVDSYLRWGFFQSIFQQKEYFSAYVFEDTALQLLTDQDDLQNGFEAWLKANPDKADDVWALLSFLYRHSEYYEPEHERYPIAWIY